MLLSTLLPPAIAIETFSGNRSTPGRFFVAFHSQPAILRPTETESQARQDRSLTNISPLNQGGPCGESPQQSSAFRFGTGNGLRGLPGRHNRGPRGTSDGIGICSGCDRARRSPGTVWRTGPISAARSIHHDAACGCCCGPRSSSGRRLSGLCFGGIRPSRTGRPHGTGRFCLAPSKTPCAIPALERPLR